MQSCQSWKYKSAFIKNECWILFPLVYLVTDMTSQVANLLNVSNMKLELIKQNVDWYITNWFRLEAVNVCLQSFLSSRLSPSNRACVSSDQSLTVLWGEVVGCIVLGLCPACQITIQSTVFPEVAVISSLDVPSKQKRKQRIFRCNILWFCVGVGFGSCGRVMKERKCSYSV